MAIDMPKWKKLQELYLDGGLASVFVQGLGWSSKKPPIAQLEFDEQSYAISVVGELKGYWVVEVKSALLPNPRIQSRIDRQLGELFAERILIFTDGTTLNWRWPRATPSGGVSYESLSVRAERLPAFIAQRLVGLGFSAREFSSGVSLVDVRDRVRGRFDASAVTKKFFDEFEKRHLELSESIQGLDGPELRSNYAIQILNRLMLLYFLQKREFLNGDSFYLENCLLAVQKLHGNGKFFSFYRNFLLPLFFERLASRSGNPLEPEIQAIVGDIPYLNGGLYEPTSIEAHFGDEIEIPDSEFSKIFELFGSYHWHLDTRASGTDNEVNPEVIGYIFEQFINVASSGKKENGAYYTPHDVTSYITGQTLLPRLLDEFPRAEIPFKLLEDSPTRYLNSSMIHGFDEKRAAWLPLPKFLEEAWAAGPESWTILDDSATDSESCLPGESWVEAFHRRERVDLILSSIESGAISSTNDLISENLNIGLLIEDAVGEIDDIDEIETLFETYSSISVLDPTCGSGAFLFAAMEMLENIYERLIEAVRSLVGAAGESSILQQVDAHPSTRYFVRKHIAIRNLYGTDLMSGAVETAKLRIFLALAACVDRREELQPLPDLDFNIKTGNLVVGFKDALDADLRLGADFVNSAYLSDLTPKIDDYAEKYAEFVEGVQNEGKDVNSLKLELLDQEKFLRQECNRVYATVSGIPDEEFETWVESARPFHWFCEFPEIIRSGGFDVVIGNPPYVRRGEVEGYTVFGYRTASAPDLYAPCYERSLSLTKEVGRHGFIVMSSLSFGDRFAELRQVISDRGGAEWWSTFGKIPSALFNGVRVRNTILLLGPGKGVKTSRHHIYSAIQREWLFPTIEYADSCREGNQYPIRGGVATEALERMSELQAPDEVGNGSVVYLRPTASYWFPPLLGPAPVLNPDNSQYEKLDSGLKEVHLVGTEELPDVISVLGGKITYLWWTAIGDDFHVNPSETLVPRRLAVLAGEIDGWRQLVVNVISAARHATYVSLNKRWYFNVRWNKIREATDPMDYFALKASGGSDDDWRNLNILYRQVMRSSGESAKGRYVSEEELSSILGW